MQSLVLLDLISYLQRLFRKGNHHLQDRKSTRLNSSHSQISYAVFCLKKKITFHVAITTAIALSPPLLLRLQAPITRIDRQALFLPSVPSVVARPLCPPWREQLAPAVS